MVINSADLLTLVIATKELENPVFHEDHFVESEYPARRTYVTSEELQNFSKKFLTTMSKYTPQNIKIQFPLKNSNIEWQKIFGQTEDGRYYCKKSMFKIMLTRKAKLERVYPQKIVRECI